MSAAPKQRSKGAEKDFLSPQQRAEDILLGALGFGEDASIISVRRTADGFAGVGAWPDGEQFSFESDETLSDLELWALGILGG
ncbi:MAG: hypothetical protein EBZ48_00280 [Proteobacteria bacterium]|nr:hypothetical protein [Pseudomonadota bacterium]